MKKKKTANTTIDKGRIYIATTFNNTLITVTDYKGNPVVMGSCGMSGFSGTRKSTPYAATVTVQNTLKKAIDTYGLRSAQVYVKGIGPGREASLRAIKALGVEVGKILDITPVPHNGVRPPKQRKG
ncbi:30S ribosomal protein S11 [Candidatus Roizmanbacteria bacterium RIFCSPHIGHO2_01_FULL_39_12b]|uniref:Small ribosomal subunit protein uS11 n=1 Tax=Candidatus Roizmanbacteria bacterium RIFCSPHIGHO2_01_FULL_39_12b TaxID=1802030 RepID=A0A1F7GC30_9BACT|nr:MAG: 30S ribosomal protein S11 [Candidatus Roizmanbacteria bacterium RIFCSPHIGHO2_01_FULL_39_12b]OGK47083.1 MAG: 30S ribosomal protein S11 [Candidatus Roizmanbacteria bacterium RIFCSPLOWO2_01_FULL_39_19]